MITGGYAVWGRSGEGGVGGAAIAHQKKFIQFTSRQRQRL